MMRYVTQNLMDTVQRTVRVCEAASIKQFATLAMSAALGIRWKRKAFKAVQGAGH